MNEKDKIEATVKRRELVESRLYRSDGTRLYTDEEHRERERRESRARWYSYFADVADSLRGRADELDGKAPALLEEHRGGGVPS